ncbi:hypothetical protein ACTWQJ_40670 [Streptomyces sp. KR55]
MPGTASPALSPTAPGHRRFGRDHTDEEIQDIPQALHRDPRSGLVEHRRAPFTWRRETDIAAVLAAPDR